MELPVAVGALVAGKYRIEGRIGSGAMGIVFAARHTELGQRVALKFLNPIYSTNDAARARFQREAKNTFALKSEHVARVLDVGKLESGEPFIVMEFLEGATLKAHVEERGKLSKEESLAIIQQLCEGVAEAHGCGVIHRDLKPENVFLTRLASGHPIVKVLDFGISKGTEQSRELTITAQDQVLGTPRYMAPEQFDHDGQASKESDVWSIGVMMYWLLSGRFPYDGGSPQLTLAKLFGGEPAADIGELVAGVEPALAAVVMKCLARKPEGRFPDADALRRALAPFSRSSVVLAKREPSPMTQRSPGSDEEPLTEGAPTSARVVDAALPPATIREPARDDERAAETLDPRELESFRDEFTEPRLTLKAKPTVKTLPLGMLYSPALPAPSSGPSGAGAPSSGGPRASSGAGAPPSHAEEPVAIPMRPAGNARVAIVLGLFAFIAFVVWLLKTR